MKIYIAGPMTGLVDFNRWSFHEAARRLEGVGFTTANPATLPAPSAYHPRRVYESHWAFYMRHALPLLLEAEAVALLPGWEESRGAKLERQIALDLEYSVASLDVILSSWSPIPE
jgi:hypothetical protein